MVSTVSVINWDILTKDDRTKKSDNKVNYKEKIKIRQRGNSWEARFTLFSEQLSITNKNKEISFINAKKILQLEEYVLQLESVADMFEKFAIQSNYSINQEICSQVIDKTVETFSYISNVLKSVNNKNIEKKNVYKKPLQAYNRIVIIRSKI